MDITPEKIAELSALATILIVVLVAVWRGIPALFAYIERKDTVQREETATLIFKHREDMMTHREDMMALIASSREERDTFYKNLGIQLDRIHDRLDKIETTVTSTKKQS
jgi:hypothetical protein